MKRVVTLCVGLDAYRYIITVSSSTDQKAANVQLSLEETHADLAPVREVSRATISVTVTVTVTVTVGVLVVAVILGFMMCCVSLLLCPPHAHCAGEFRVCVCEHHAWVQQQQQQQQHVQLLHRPLHPRPRAKQADAKVLPVCPQIYITIVNNSIVLWSIKLIT